MDITKALLVKSSREILTQSQQQTQATYIQVKEIMTSVNLLYVEDTSEKLQRVLK